MTEPSGSGGKGLRYIAASLEVEVDEGRIWVDGVPAALSNRPFQLLCALMSRPEQIWSKDDLIEAVWDGLAVSDAVLTTAMKELRRAIGDPARSPKFIETVHARGYRFLLSVETSFDQADDQAVSHSSSDRIPTGGAVQETPVANGEHLRERKLWPIAALILTLPVIAIILWLAARGSDASENARAAVQERGAAGSQAANPKSVLVLPFEDLSLSREEAWFVGGLTEEITSTLAKTPDLNVISGGLSFRAGQAVNAAHILEGSVRRSENRIRVTARLIRTAGQQAIWTQSYDRENAEMITIQEDIAFQIAKALRTVTDPVRLAEMVETGTRSVEAYEALLAGHHFLRQQYITGEPEYRRRSYDEYERARAIDPNFAEAHWQAARYWSERSTYIFPPGEESLQQTEEVSERFEERINAAIRSASNDVEEQLYSAALYAHRLEYQVAHRLLADYVTERPRDVYAWVMRARVAVYVGDYETAQAAANELAALADETSLYFSRTIPNLMWVWDFDSAYRQAMYSLKSAPENAFVQYHAHRILLWKGKATEAKALLPQIEAGELAVHNKKLAAMRQACAEGDRSTAETLAVEIRNLAPPRIAASWLAEMMLGRNEAANSVLSPYDRDGYLHQIAPFMIYPHFDSRPFDTLVRALTAENIDRPTPLKLPYACP